MLRSCLAAASKGLSSSAQKAGAGEDDEQGDEEGVQEATGGLVGRGCVLVGGVHGVACFLECVVRTTGGIRNPLQELMPTVLRSCLAAALEGLSSSARGAEEGEEQGDEEGVQGAGGWAATASGLVDRGCVMAVVEGST